MGVATLRPPVKWYGGKHYLAKKIISLFPQHQTYVEPFGGGASVLLNKQPSEVEFYNDVDGELVNFFMVLRDRSEELIHRLTLTPYSEAEFRGAGRFAADTVERARLFLVRQGQSFDARGKSYARSPPHQSRRGMAKNVSAWLSAIDDVLPEIVERLRRVEISCVPAVDLIRRCDGPHTLFYCDPPYVLESREPHSRRIYSAEMTDDDHKILAHALRACKGKVIISGYPSPLYDRLYRSWHSVRFNVPLRSSQQRTKPRRTEVLWLNFKLDKKEVPPRPGVAARRIAAGPTLNGKA